MVDPKKEDSEILDIIGIIEIYLKRICGNSF
jgi:hypothetical protein